MGSILLVEADAATREQWTRALDAAGHAVLEASAFGDAPTMLRDGGIDAVVIDCYGGECMTDVIELVRALQKLPDAPPIVLVSSSPTAPEISARIGASTFLPKPCEPAEVVSAVNRLVGELRPVRIVDDEPTGRTQTS